MVLLILDFQEKLKYWGKIFYPFAGAFRASAMSWVIFIFILSVNPEN